MRHSIPFASLAAIAGLAALTVSLPIAPPAAASSIAAPTVLSFTRSISSAEILAISGAAPLQLLAAPGANRGIVIIACELSVIYNGTLYTNSGNGAFALSYNTSASTVACASNIASALSAVAANTYVTGANNGSLGGFTPNAPINLAKNLSSFTLGNGTMRVTLLYTIVPTV